MNLMILLMILILNKIMKILQMMMAEKRDSYKKL